MLSDLERVELLRLARASLRACVQGAPAVTPQAGGALSTCCGAFVTLRYNGTLRGCIGHVDCDQPLAQVVWRCAAAASCDDPRFDPVTAAELEDLRLEISVLGPFEPIRHPEEIEVGRHGLLVQQGIRRGLLLPQVAVEWGWTPEDLLRQTCIKAGLARTAWQRGAQIFRFEALVFAERDEAEGVEAS